MGTEPGSRRENRPAPPAPSPALLVACASAQGASGTEAASVPPDGSALPTVAVLSGMVVVLGILWWIATIRLARFASSIRELAATARGISPGHLEIRFRVRHSPSVLRELGRELNGLLHRMQDGVHASSQFASNVAHELRTPLTALLAEVQVLKLGSPVSGEQRAFLDRAEAELHHLAALVQSFLVMARIEAGEGRRDPVHLDDVVRRARDRCNPAAQRKSVRLEVSCPETSASRDPFVSGDAELLQALVENLVRNAIRHSPGGASVEIRTHRADDVARVIVSDRGPGIAHEQRKAVFERGFGTADTHPEGDGFGLGLSIVRSVADLHDGHIAIECNEEGGCDFIVTLPAIRNGSSAAH